MTTKEATDKVQETHRLTWFLSISKTYAGEDQIENPLLHKHHKKLVPFLHRPLRIDPGQHPA